MANILVIDDEPVLLDLISTSLQRDGHHVTAISDPMSAFDSVDNAKPVFALVLTDVDMKPMSGFEIVKQLNHKGWRGPVLFMSGHSSLSGAVGGKLAGRAMIEKPFTASQLRTAVTRALTKESKAGTPSPGN